jgi:hypothetical protein
MVNGHRVVSAYASPPCKPLQTSHYLDRRILLAIQNPISTIKVSLDLLPVIHQHIITSTTKLMCDRHPSCHRQRGFTLSTAADEWLSTGKGMPFHNTWAIHKS